MSQGNTSPGRWHGQGPGPTDDVGTKHRNYVVIVLGVILALAAVVVGILLLYKRTELPYLLSIPVGEYTYFPHQPFALRDSELLQQRFGVSNVTRDSQDRERFLEQLNYLKKRADRPVVVHLSCHAVTWDGDVYLLPAGAAPGNSHSWVSLSTVLDLLDACPARGKLLILDIAHPLADARFGVLSDHAMEEVEIVLKNRKLDAMWVLCSCSAGQLGQVSEELHASVFGYYLNLGLRGDADGAGDGLPDTHVRVKELALYVADRTERWAQQYKGLSQTPRLWGGGDDFTLAFAEREPLPSPPAAKLEYPPWLRLGWQHRDDWSENTALRHATKAGNADDKPPDVAKKGERLMSQALPGFEVGLLRLEQRWRGEPVTAKTPQQPGQGDEKGAEEKKGTEKAKPPDEKKALEQKALADTSPLAKDLRDWESIAKKFTLTPLEYRPRSLAQAVALAGRQPSASLVDKIRRNLNNLKETPGKKADDAGDGLLSAKEAKELPPPLVAQAMLLAAAGLSDPDRQQTGLVKKAIEKTLKLDEQPDEQFLEIVFLERLHDLDQMLRKKDIQEFWTWPAKQVHWALRAILQREDLLALVCREPSLRPGVDERLVEADKLRRNGEFLLMTGRPVVRDDAARDLRKAASEYEALHSWAVSIAEARQALEAARELLPGYALYLSARDQPLKAYDDVWSDACSQAQRLADFFAQPLQASVEPPVKGTALGMSLSTLQDRLINKNVKSLLQRFEELKKPQESQGPPTAANVHELQALLASPCLTAGDREALWRAGHELRSRLLDATGKNDQRLKTTLPKVAPVAAPRAQESWPAQSAQALRRAQLSLDLLTLAGVKNLDSSWKALEQAKNKTRPQDFDTLGQQIGKVWQTLEQRTPTPELADRLGYLLPLKVTRVDQQRRDEQQTVLKDWLALRFDEEYQSLSKSENDMDRKASDFFFKCARELRR